MLPSRLLRSADRSPVPQRSETSSSPESSMSSIGRPNTAAQPSQSTAPPEITTAELISDLSTLLATAQTSSQPSLALNVVRLPSSSSSPSANRETNVREDPTLHKVREVLKFQSVISEKQARFQPSGRGMNGTLSPPPAIVNGIARNGVRQPQDALEVAVAEVERDVLMMLDRMKQSGLDVNDGTM
ncbi:hypothetical protein POJ06DRAFT_131177 [Lipomyces tetrasporus]|uniref:Uncharacterized protein n=1 Tax=Lipomyces tetrasporus TaxID=54092 RepID=A0AAD7QPV6_9ASCO|nr:uncharacterized protein POJ06DRAFT_131177 [Lipomyces tetrasporus]KAJ8099230.1 hypothetical protein POJ06DRAFT_131177 [Lipomyces tetrasporus]